MSQLAKAQNADPALRYTLQVVAFPKRKAVSRPLYRRAVARRRAARLRNVELPGRGKWILISSALLQLSELAATAQATGSRPIKEFLSGRLEISSAQAASRSLLEKRYAINTPRPIIASVCKSCRPQPVTRLKLITVCRYRRRCSIMRAHLRASHCL